MGHPWRRSDGQGDTSSELSTSTSKATFLFSSLLKVPHKTESTFDCAHSEKAPCPKNVDDVLENLRSGPSKFTEEEHNDTEAESDEDSTLSNVLDGSFQSEHVLPEPTRVVHLTYRHHPQETPEETPTESIAPVQTKKVKRWPTALLRFRATKTQTASKSSLDLKKSDEPSKESSEEDLLSPEDKSKQNKDSLSVNDEDLLIDTSQKQALKSQDSSKGTTQETPEERTEQTPEQTPTENAAPVQTKRAQRWPTAMLRFGATKTQMVSKSSLELKKSDDPSKESSEEDLLSPEDKSKQNKDSLSVNDEDLLKDTSQNEVLVAQGTCKPHEDLPSDEGKMESKNCAEAQSKDVTDDLVEQETELMPREIAVPDKIKPKRWSKMKLRLKAMRTQIALNAFRMVATLKNVTNFQRKKGLRQPQYSRQDNEELSSNDRELSQDASIHSSSGSESYNFNDGEFPAGSPARYHMSEEPPEVQEKSESDPSLSLSTRMSSFSPRRLIATVSSLTEEITYDYVDSDDDSEAGDCEAIAANFLRNVDECILPKCYQNPLAITD